MPSLTAKVLAAMQDEGTFKLKPLIMGDNDGVFRAVTSENPKTASEPILTPHVRAYREMLDKQQIGGIGWCDNRDMLADPLTKGKTRRNDLNVMLNRCLPTPSVWEEAASRVCSSHRLHPDVQVAVS